MSGSLLNAIGTAGSVVNSVGSAASGLSRLSGLIASSPVGSWLSGLQAASWRGVPFAVTLDGTVPGRQTAVHVYPYAEEDPAWVEDIGLAPRPFSLTGFLVDGDALLGYSSLALQQAAMIEACEAKSSGTLVHPSLGTRRVSLIGGCEMVQRLGAVGSIELRFSFLQTSDGPRYAGGTTSTTDATTAAASTAGTASATGFTATVGPAVASGAEVVGQAATTVGKWAAQASVLVGDAARAASAASGIVGFVGRYGGSRTSLQPATATLGSLIAASTTAVSAVRSAGMAVQSLAAAL